MTLRVACGRLKRVALSLVIATLAAAVLPGLAHAGVGDLGSPLSGDSVPDAEITETVAGATEAVTDTASAVAPAANPGIDVPSAGTEVEQVAAAATPATERVAEQVAATVAPIVPESVPTVTGVPQVGDAVRAEVVEPVADAVSGTVTPTLATIELAGDTVAPLARAVGEAVEPAKRISSTAPVVSGDVTPVTSPDAAAVRALAEGSLVAPADPRAPRARPAATTADSEVERRVAAGVRPRSSTAGMNPSLDGWTVATPTGSTLSTGRDAPTSTKPARIPLPPSEQIGGSTLASAGAFGASAAAFVALLAAFLLAAPGLGRLIRPGMASWPLSTPHLSFERPG